jgi:protease-4
MSYDPDALLGRRRLKRRLRLWQGITILAVIGIVLVSLHASGELLHGDRIARIYVEGVIVRDDARAQTLAELAADESVRGVVIHIDSPGGTVVGGEDLYKGLRGIAEHKPVAAVMGADRVFVREGTITGSIGVILQMANVMELLNKIGVEPITIKSSELKGIPSPVEPLTETGREATKEVVGDLYDFFVDIVAARRGFDRDTALKLADGRIFAGRQALDAGLVDEIGDEHAALAWMVETQDVPAGLPVDTVEESAEAETLLERLLGVSGKSLFSNTLTLDGMVSLWQPAAR